MGRGGPGQLVVLLQQLHSGHPETAPSVKLASVPSFRTISSKSRGKKNYNPLKTSLLGCPRQSIRGTRRPWRDLLLPPQSFPRSETKPDAAAAGPGRKSSEKCGPLGLPAPQGWPPPGSNHSVRSSPTSQKSSSEETAGLKGSPGGGTRLCHREQGRAMTGGAQLFK